MYGIQKGICDSSFGMKCHQLQSWTTGFTASLYMGYLLQMQMLPYWCWWKHALLPEGGNVLQLFGLISGIR